MPSKQKKQKPLSDRQVENLVRIVRERVGQIECACGFSFGEDGYICIQVLGTPPVGSMPLEIAGIPVVSMLMNRDYIRNNISIYRERGSKRKSSRSRPS